MALRYPARRARSVGLTPAALTLILICPAPGSGSGTAAHFSTSGGPYSVITTALGMSVPSSHLSNYVTYHVIVNVIHHVIAARRLRDPARLGPRAKG